MSYKMLDSKEILLKRYHQHQLAQVYLAHYPTFASPEAWVSEFCSQITPLLDHPDVLIIRRTEKENNYKVDSPAIVELLKFINYRPLKLQQRFIFIYDAHLLSEIVSNKLLKVLEELASHFCLFLLCPEGQHLLPTVESRAINLRITPELNNAEVISNEHFQSVFEFIQYLKTCVDQSNEEKKFIESQIDLLLSKNPTFAQCEDMLTNLKHYEKSARYNNAKASRLSLFYP